jgi:hypothetical protein
MFTFDPFKISKNQINWYLFKSTILFYSKELIKFSNNKKLFNYYLIILNNFLK